MIEFILTEVPKYGWLCKIHEDGKEVYRGEFQGYAMWSLDKARDWLEERNG